MSNILSDLAKEAMVKAGFNIEFPSEVIDEIESYKIPTPENTPSIRDMREKLWISIDNEDTEDLDQLTYAETILGKNKIFIAIADVDSLVHYHSNVDNLASQNTTSVYTPTIIFPMLPRHLSENLTSLKEHTDRLVIVVEIEIKPDGKFGPSNIYQAWVRNYAKLTYDGVANWLKFNTPLPNPETNKPEIFKQIKLQDLIAQQIKKFRYQQGALNFYVTELEPIIIDGMAVGFIEQSHNRAHGIIENYMIAANVIVARFMLEKKIPTIRRVVRTPKRWDRIVSLAKDRGVTLPNEPNAVALKNFMFDQQKRVPSTFTDLSIAIIKLIGQGEYIAAIPGDRSIGHFDLALPNYAHCTAPNRRFSDLILQRQLKNHLNGKPLIYQEEELTVLAKQCTTREHQAATIERQIKKSAIAMVLSKHVGEEYEAIVTGVKKHGIFVRVFNPPIEGKLIHGYRDLDVGDRIIVELISTNVIEGHIDFNRIQS